MEKYFSVNAPIRVAIRRIVFLIAIAVAGVNGNWLPFFATAVVFVWCLFWLDENEHLKWGSPLYLLKQWWRDTYEPLMIVFVYCTPLLIHTGFSSTLGLSPYYRVVDSPIENRVVSPWEVELYIPGVEWVTYWKESFTHSTVFAGNTADGKAVSADLSVELTYVDVPLGLLHLKQEYGGLIRYWDALDAHLGAVFSEIISKYSLEDLPSEQVLADLIGTNADFSRFGVYWDGELEVSDIQRIGIAP